MRLSKPGYSIGLQNAQHERQNSWLSVVCFRKKRDLQSSPNDVMPVNFPVENNRLGRADDIAGAYSLPFSLSAPPGPDH